ncbi:nucleoporin complex subunit 54-domain-containing protein [Chlamydoabsidia padenii]|nr:nucleoporin complex subunit 54-domain-containing protein [Chlamydoabsidia padenii]
MNSFTFGGSSSQPSTGFGAPASNHSAAGTLFGGASNTGFGTTANNTTGNTSAGTLFGKPATGTSSAGTLFGTTPTTSSGTFGFGSTTPASTAPTTGFGGGFGNTQQQQAPATSMPSFGGGFGTSTTATTTTQAPTTSFSGFGNNAQQQQQGQTAATTGFSGFGTGGFGNTQTQQQQQKPAFGGFGGFNSTTPSTGFGNTAPSTGFGSTAPSTGFGGFGNNQQQQQQSTTGGFGSNNAGLFGQQKPATGFGFGQSTGNAFGQPQQSQPQPQQPQYNVWQQLALIKAHWDPSSPLCQFRHYFYNMVPPNEVQLYVRPPNQDEQLWNEAQQKNPDPSCMVPVLAVGFEDVLKRMNIQDQQSELHKEKLEEIDQRLETVRRKYELGSRARLEEHKRRHADLTQRVIRLLRTVQVIRYKGIPLNQQEELCQKQLEELSTRTNNPEQLYTKMLALWSQLQNIKTTRTHTDDGRWEALNQHDTNRIAKILGDEQQGLMHVTDMLTKDLEDVKALEANLKLEAKNKENKQPLTI